MPFILIIDETSVNYTMEVVHQTMKVLGNFKASFLCILLHVSTNLLIDSYYEPLSLLMLCMAVDVSLQLQCFCFHS